MCTDTLPLSHQSPLSGFYGQNLIKENMHDSTRMYEQSNHSETSGGHTFADMRTITSAFWKTAVVCSISGNVWDRPPKEAGLDRIGQRFGSSLGGAEEKREGGQVQRHQVKQRARGAAEIRRAANVYLRIPGCRCNVNVYAAGSRFYRHQSAQRPQKGWRLWFQTRPWEVWKVKSPPAVIAK